MQKIFHSNIPTNLIFGPGSLEELRKVSLPGSHALLVTTGGKSVTANGALKRVTEILLERNCTISEFNEIEPNPTYETAMAGAKKAKEVGCDFIVALGGGSVMDCSKAIAMMASNEGDLWDYVWGKTGKKQKLPNEPMPIVAITTTAGTGSEVDAWGVITKLDTKEKIGVGGMLGAFPKISIVDCELMTTVPPKLTAYQGFDALFHSIEGYLSKAKNRLSDMYALEAIRSISKGLPRVIRDGSDLEARDLVAFGNTLSGLVMSVGDIMSEHSLEHALSAYHPNLTHGAGLIMISLAYYKHLIDKGVEPERFVTLAQALGKTEASKPEEFLIALRSLQEICGVDNLKMSDWGIQADELEEIAQNAFDTMTGLFKQDPIEITVKDAFEILLVAYK